MRAIPEGLKESLAGPATTIARCWRLTRADGVVLGFTDHDETLRFAGTPFEAASGMAAGEAEVSLGLAAGTQEVEGALSGAAIDEAGIAAGLFDGARVETFAVDWTRPERHIRLSVASIGEIRRAGQAFTAELRGPEAMLDRERGRSYRRRCDAAFGDRRCGIDPEAARWVREGRIAAAEASGLAIEGLAAFDRALFERGRLSFTGGRNDGHGREVAGLEIGSEPGEWRVVFAEPFPFAPLAGERVRLTAGCDKSFTTCRERFGNALNFRGFPHLPGLDAVLAVAKRDDRHDGSPLVP